jgi:hypothetical protein
VLGEFSWEEESDGGLDLPGGDGGPLVVVGESGGLGRDPLEDVVHEGVHDGHGLGGDAGVGVDLLQHLVDVHRVRLLPLLVTLLLSALHNVLRLRHRLLARRFSSCLGWHVDISKLLLADDYVAVRSRCE